MAYEKVIKLNKAKCKVLYLAQGNFWIHRAWKMNGSRAALPRTWQCLWMRDWT